MASVRRFRGRETREQSGLSDAQYSLLFGLRGHRELSLSELAFATELSPASATKMLDTLIISKLVRRKRSERDRRVVLISLTERGIRLIEERRARYEPLWRAALADFSDEELRTAALVLCEYENMPYAQIAQTLDASVPQVKTWIFRVAVNVAKMRANREAHSIPFSALTDEPIVDPERFVDGRWRNAPTSFDRLEQHDALRCLNGTIAGLPAQQRRVITLRDVCGLSATEVCDLLSLTPENQRVLLHRARAKARAALEQLQPDDRALIPVANTLGASSAEGIRP